MPSSIDWQKSSFSGGGEEENCVEVGISAGHVHLRESDTPAVAVTTTPLALTGLLRLIRGDRPM
ncbi:DUF397 domain-containing protein [Streptomyces sp. NPDC050610]|uniref:DUF397 domain-containing protein n=1 Tax=Streptomyces sp. NPDC050610 TaxID=3157097 RepID=UPI0034224E3E